MATKEDIERFPYRIEIEEEKTLSVIVEGRKPNCYLCGTRGHIKKECPLYEFVAECEQELEEKKNTVNEKESIEKETKQQEKGNNKSMKEKEIKEKKEIEPKQSQEKKGKRNNRKKTREGSESNEKKRRHTKGKEHKAREKEKTDTEPKRQEKERERKEGKKREREKQREENKEEISPKRKMKENAGRKQDYYYYKLVTYHFCPVMNDLTSKTEGHV
ncbi:XP_036361568.1uncharacterized protein LOC118764671 [Octopus vulgaris]|uniref:XP_036361568.1uncharacterized protein LOC118764671 n=1 Tax=Octopus vulgaris TaxID=6645 RepID=A0AA36BPM9_OCTVU|nr:XP_036361568.1uncharacterized protein LOC118764671 [Octopus vulgaris]